MKPFNFQRFYDCKRIRNRHIREPGLWLYVRRSNVYRSAKYGVLFDLANMTADVPGKGALTAFLDAWEPKVGFFVESILNERLVAYLLRRGYAFTNPKVEFSPDMYKRGPNEP